MCLAIPAKIIEILPCSHELYRQAKVDFSGVYKIISLAYLPEAKLNDYVIVHAGLALSILDQQQALETLTDLQQLADIYPSESLS
jgi:hydrogenase expression/formation protein HypC